MGVQHVLIPFILVLKAELGAESRAESEAVFRLEVNFIKMDDDN